MTLDDRPCDECLQALGAEIYNQPEAQKEPCYVCAALRQTGEDGEVIRMSQDAESSVEKDGEERYWMNVIIYSDRFAGQQIEKSERYFVPQSEIDLALAATWLATCEADHGSACGEKPFSAAGVSGAGILLIDLQDMCIVQSTLETRYVCLSYVWGGVQQLKLMRDSLASFKQPGSLQTRMDEISQTIKDTMIVVKGLGERYLWIDCLCIVQDDAEHRAIQIAQMAAIYGAGLLTIVTVASQDANSPLPGVTGERRPDILKKASEMTLAKEPLNLMGLNDILVGTKHQSRAWTFQEVDLSRRCLFFANEQVYFQCQTSRSRESTGPSCIKSMMVNRTGNYPSLTSTTSYTFRWEETLLDFSGRDLTFPSDRLDALSAVTKAFEIAHRCRFLYGVLMDHWTWSLLWLPADTRTCEPSQEYDMFPSWSWLSHKGGVFHAGYFRGAMPFQTQVDWSYARVWDGKKSHSVLDDKASKDDTLYEDYPAGLLIFGAWKLPLRALETPPSSAGPIAFDPDPVGESSIPSPFDASIAARLSDNPGERPAFTNLVTDEGVWCGALCGVDPAQLLRITEEDNEASLELIPISLAKINWCHFWLNTRKDREESEGWKMINVMLVKTGARFSRRVAVGQILIGAWRQEAAEAELFKVV